MSSAMNLIPINAPSLAQAPQTPIKVAAPPGTDLWRKPPSHDVSNAPCYVTNFPVANFQRARATISANWTRQYDQGGLVLFLPGWPSHKLWVKTGIEFYEGAPHVSTVAARDAADWSLLPVPAGQTTVTLEIEREEVDAQKGTGSSLWVYLVQDGKRTATREVTWVFKEKGDMTGMISIGVYAARPTKKGQSDVEDLVVKFEDLAIDRKDTS
jgi:regulation of enolase protein 1 (concanavalin A-like superfamily)